MFEREKWVHMSRRPQKTRNQEQVRVDTNMAVSGVLLGKLEDETDPYPSGSRPCNPIKQPRG